jgi:hypothetical protein
MTKNGRWGQKPHQLTTKNTSPKKTCLHIIKSGGMNVQTVPGNSNLGHSTPINMRGERQGGARWRLIRKIEEGVIGAMGQGKDGLEIKSCR